MMVQETQPLLAGMILTLCLMTIQEAVLVRGRFLKRLI